ncbi:MarR family winged helix-turn-helix transcriptional regulator [Alicyclobacillus fodiniaquatilis]|jgi:DNA-binding MarR family transcriptional regulator|uniref:MarR family winged helix-turn-helix transcriptional regulator n=1 Tax=Alicyclobacillus fodiniaquatilis TaxID=1661150 RepID=A0ABW4JGC1_9BACL
MIDNGLIDQFFVHWQSINRHLRKGTLQVGAQKITRLQWTLLRNVHKTKNCTMGDLAKKFGVSPSTVSQMADRLEKAGLVYRVSSDEDARVKVVRLTDSGRSLIESVHSASTKRLTDGLNCLSPDEQRHLIASLERLSSALSHPADENVAEDK